MERLVFVNNYNSSFSIGIPRYNLLYNVACLLAVNGVASFHYHYHLSWVGKQADEIAMILANYFGQWALINMYYRSHEQNSINRYNTAFMYVFLVLNTLTKYDFLFPSIFGIYVGGTLIMIHRVSKNTKCPTGPILPFPVLELFVGLYQNIIVMNTQNSVMLYGMLYSLSDFIN